MAQTDEWRTVIGFPDYTINRNGVVYNTHLKHVIKSTEQGTRNVVLRRTEAKNGALQVVNYSIPLGKLVAQAFIPNPYNRKFAVHVNQDPTDNRVCNLCWSVANRISPYGLVYVIDTSVKPYVVYPFTSTHDAMLYFNPEFKLPSPTYLTNFFSLKTRYNIQGRRIGVLHQGEVHPNLTKTYLVLRGNVALDAVNNFLSKRVRPTLPSHFDSNEPYVIKDVQGVNYHALKNNQK